VCRRGRCQHGGGVHGGVSRRPGLGFGRRRQVRRRV
jgi:hypothetical protein